MEQAFRDSNGNSESVKEKHTTPKEPHDSHRSCCSRRRTVRGIASSALAIPDVLKQLPDNTGFAVAIPNPRGPPQSQQLTMAAEIPLPPMGVTDMLAMHGVTDGVDADKADGLCGASCPGARRRARRSISIRGTSERVVLLVPTTSYEAILNNFGMKPTGEVDSGTTPDGQEVFTKDLKNGYAAIGHSRERSPSISPGPRTP